jgi:hypothetical protein
MALFMELLYSCPMRWGGMDTFFWTPSSRKELEVKSLYTLLNPTSIRPNFLWKSLWKPKVLPRVAFFLWTAVLGKILTIYNLKSSGKLF